CLPPRHEPGEDNPSARIRSGIALGGFAAALGRIRRRFACRSALRTPAAAAFDWQQQVALATLRRRLLAARRRFRFRRLALGAARGTPWRRAARFLFLGEA